tara:strand:- start:636 stop:1271 length:636 start_codon:yes stop_codon:yes gene_type:complete
MSELTKALIGFHKAVDKIDKNARANYGKFADLANVLSTVTPPLHANGLAITQTFDDQALVTTLHHTSGETISSSCQLMICDGRNQTQEWGKAVTYQRRYAICSILGIVADMDTDAESEPQPEKKVSRPARKAESAKPADAAPAGPKPNDPMKDDEKELLHGVIKELKADHKQELIKRFRKEFNYPEGLVKDKIQTYAHRTFLQNAMNEITA